MQAGESLPFFNFVESSVSLFAFYSEFFRKQGTKIPLGCRRRGRTAGIIFSDFPVLPIPGADRR